MVNGNKHHHLCFLCGERKTNIFLTLMWNEERMFRNPWNFYFEVADLGCEHLLLLWPNPELCWNNWIHLRVTEDSLLA